MSLINSFILIYQPLIFKIMYISSMLIRLNETDKGPQQHFIIKKNKQLFETIYQISCFALSDKSAVACI